MTIYTTGITSLISYPTYQNRTDCVFQIDWIIRGTDDNGITCSSSGTTDVPYDPNETYIPYVDLTFDDVMRWWTEHTPADVIAAAHASIDEQINAALNPSSQSLPLPWNTP